MFEQFTISTTVNKDIHTCFHTYHTPEHIKNWNFASDDWKCPSATSSFHEGGRFNYRMEAKDGSVGFDFTGMFTKIVEPTYIKYRLDDEREVTLVFTDQGPQTFIECIIDAEEENSVALQKRGWQAILNQFKRYVESF